MQPQSANHMIGLMYKTNMNLLIKNNKIIVIIFFIELIFSWTMIMRMFVLFVKFEIKFVYQASVL